MPFPSLAAVDERSVTFVNRFSLHGSPEEFERAFAETSAFMGSQPGFLFHALLRHEGKEDQYVNIALWRDAASLRAAVGNRDFQPHASALRALSTSEPNIYLPRQVRAGHEFTLLSNALENDR